MAECSKGTEGYQKIKGENKAKHIIRGHPYIKMKEVDVRFMNTSRFQLEVVSRL